MGQLADVLGRFLIITCNHVDSHSQALYLFHRLHTGFLDGIGHAHDPGQPAVNHHIHGSLSCIGVF